MAKAELIVDSGRSFEAISSAMGNVGPSESPTKPVKATLSVKDGTSHMQI